MRYLCLIYGVERSMEELTAAEYAAIERECLGYEGELRRGGQLLAVEALQPSAVATTVRLRGGRVIVTDGPFAETREQLAGFYLIDARDLNEAIRVASRIPPIRFGSVEVRPLRERATGHQAEGVA